MEVQIIGSCRTCWGDMNNLRDVAPLYASKEVLQFLTYLFDKSNEDTRICFTRNPGAVATNAKTYRELMVRSNVICVEISSRKYLKYKKPFLQTIGKKDYKTELNVVKNFGNEEQGGDSYRLVPFHSQHPTVQDDYEICHLKYVEIENDLIDLKALVAPRKLIIITHIYNAEIVKYFKLNNPKFYARKELIDLLKKLCVKHKVNIFVPGEHIPEGCVSKFLQDCNHYTTAGALHMQAQFIDYLKVL